jgi:MFS superfamily sulfate permease-like transporter
MRLQKVSKQEFYLALITSLSVITIGVIPAVMVAVGLSLTRLLARTSTPTDCVLGKVEESNSYHNAVEFKNAKTFPGLLIYRFDAAILFFNSDYFLSRARLKIIDPANYLDITAADALISLSEELKAKGIGMGIAGAKAAIRKMITASGLEKSIGSDNLFSTIDEGVKHFLES